MAAVFIISQAITTSVAVWNMSTVQASATSCKSPSLCLLPSLVSNKALGHVVVSVVTVASQVDVYLIVLGSAGLLLIFPM